MGNLLILGMVALLAAGCGGSGGGSGGPGDPGDTPFLTADVPGISALMAPGARKGDSNHLPMPRLFA